jgi:uncharacterized tellurite resistance protein B-like protein
MASQKAAALRTSVFHGVDTADPLISMVCLLLDVLSANGTDGASANAVKNVLAQLAAVSTQNSDAAIRFLAREWNTLSDHHEQRG